jgi:hypothetical protein
LDKNFEIVVVEIDYRAEDSKAGGIDKNIHRPKHGRDLLEQPLNLVFIADVSWNDTRLRSNHARSVLQVCPGAGCKNNLGAELAQFDSNCASDAAACAGYDCNLIFDGNHRGSLIGAYAYFLILILQLIQLVIDSPLRKQLLMCADFPHASFMHDDDLVTALDR